MADRLSKIAAPKGANTPKTRAGRGVGSGLGKTAGRGQKGQKARSTGGMGRLRFQGGQTPLQRRIPKRGFRNPFGTDYAIVNVASLNAFSAGDIVNPDRLLAAGLVRKGASPVKVLGDGELKKSITVHAHAFSASAREKILSAGGKVEILK